MKKITKAILKKRENKRNKSDLKKRIELWKLRIIERDNWTCQKTGKKLLTRKQCHPHHIVSLNSVLRKYPELIDDLNNGILLGFRAHKAAPDSAHQSPLEFTLWLEKNRPKQYEHLKRFLEMKEALGR